MSATRLPFGREAECRPVYLIEVQRVDGYEKVEGTPCATSAPAFRRELLWRFSYGQQMRQEDWLAALPEHLEMIPAWLKVGIRLWEDHWEMGNALKQAAHAALYHDFPRSERLARGLIELGRYWEEEGLIALGEMALGDALRLQGRYEDGYRLLDQAAARFDRIGDEVGWARTRIGWMGHLQTQKQYPPLAPIVTRVVEIFERHRAWPWLATFCQIYATFLQFHGKRDEQLEWCLRARRAALQIEDEGARTPVLLLSLLALMEACTDLGDYEQAEQMAREALRRFQGHEQGFPPYSRSLGHVGRFYLNTGRYAQALYHLYEANRWVANDQDRIYIDFLIAAVYRHLNRLVESERLLRPLLARTSADPELFCWDNDIRLLLTHVLRMQGRWEEALEVLEPALQSIQTMQGTPTRWLCEAYQQQMYLMYRLGRSEGLTEIARQALHWAEANQEPFYIAETNMLAAEVVNGHEAARPLLERAEAACKGIPWLRWRVSQLAARLAIDPEQRGQLLVRAADDLDAVQSSLAASFHADYLAEAEMLYHELIAYYLDRGDVRLAWQTLERAKSRALINSMLFPAEEQERPAMPLIAELERLQVSHYAQVKARLDGRATWEDVRAIEQEIERVQEAIQVEMMGRREPLAVPAPLVPEAPPGSVLVGYYLVRDQVHAFVHDGERHCHHALPTTAEQLNGILTALFINMQATPNAKESWIPALTQQIHGVLEQFDRLLLLPLRPYLHQERLVIVPHGLLHQFPFHLLRHDGRYLLEEHTLWVVPTARLVSGNGGRPATRGGRHIVISHPWNGSLRQTAVEAVMVAEILGNAEVISDGAVTRGAMHRALREADILHIAAHGEHRADAPHFSYIQLEDGQLCMADLFHLSLDNSLVTLSACDTGQAVVRSGDDPVGLWRGFLAAGARALLVALWQVEDGCAMRIMRRFYEELMRGASKTEALRSVQREWLAEAEGRYLHPSYWGAFQLIGDGEPLPFSRP